MSVGVKTKIEEYYSLGPRRFSVLRSVTLSQAVEASTGEMQQHLSLVLASDDRGGAGVLRLELSGVRNLKLLQPGWSLLILSNLEIHEAPPTGQFDRRFVVLDAEEGVISCSCDDFHAAVDE